MWPFSGLRQRQYQRAFDAAVAVFLGAYLPQLLKTEQNREVEAMVDKMIRRERVYPPAVHRRWASWDGKAAYRVVAMARVDVTLPTALGTWETLLKRWKHGVFTWYDMRPIRISWDFHPFHPATEAARKMLQVEGLQVPNADPIE